MLGLKGKQKLQAILLVLIVAAIAYASASGPDARYTGAPGDVGTCVACHDTFEHPDVGPGSVRIEDVPETYTPGQQYDISVTVQQASRIRFGFQLTAIDNGGNRAGTLTPINNSTQINSVTGAGGRQYIQHTQSGTSGQTTKTWQIRWTAPATDMGTVTFYVAGNAANNNGENAGDHIYTNRVRSESPSTAVTLSLLTEFGGMSLGNGASIKINWNLTNPTSVDNVEVRYSTDDGATFPIGNIILAASDPSVDGVDWTVPDVTTSQARIRVQAGTKSGALVEVRSGRFSIHGSDTPVLLRVTDVSISGKKLIITGDGFRQGSKVEVNGNPEKTKSGEDAEHELVCKKAGKKIERGSTVSIVVRNPDGTQSEPFTYTRPL
jgi:hypothetical protein